MEIAGYKPRVVLSSLVMTAFSVGTASGATGDWLLRAGIGETAESPAVWSDAGNWHEGAVPSATGDGAYLTNALAFRPALRQGCRRFLDLLASGRRRRDNRHGRVSVCDQRFRRHAEFLEPQSVPKRHQAVCRPFRAECCRQRPLQLLFPVRRRVDELHVRIVRHGISQARPLRQSRWGDEGQSAVHFDIPQLVGRLPRLCAAGLAHQRRRQVDAKGRFGLYLAYWGKSRDIGRNPGARNRHYGRDVCQAYLLG